MRNVAKSSSANSYPPAIKPKGTFAIIRQSDLDKLPPAVPPIPQELERLNQLAKLPPFCIIYRAKRYDVL